MAGLDIPFTAITIDAEESFPSDLVKGDIPLYISRAKAKAYESQLEEDQLLITADTIVWCDNHMLGKPKDLDDACAMLRQLRVGLGSDFDGIEVTPEGVENIARIGEVLEEMRRRGYSEEAISKVSGQNLLDVMRRIVNCSE